MATTSFTKKLLGLEALETGINAATAGNTTFAKKLKLPSGKPKRRDIPEGIWKKCPKCATMVFDKELDENQKVCTHCSYHFPIGARERIHSLVSTCTFEEMDANMTSLDVLQFTGTSSYAAKLEGYRNSTGLRDAVVTGIGLIGEHRAALGVMDFSFLGDRWGRWSAKNSPGSSNGPPRRNCP